MSLYGISNLEDIFKLMEIQSEIAVDYNEEEKTMNINIVGEDMGVLIGKRGQTLDSLQYLVSLIVNKESTEYIRVKVDTENLNKLGIEYKGFHAFRHSYATRMMESNVPVKAISDMLGHSDISTTKIYTRVSDEKVIEDYNKKQTDNGKEENVINYSDMVGMMMSSVTVIVDMISYVLIAFVSISLIVSSIMIGIITYISVLERTKEIGVLRAMGASKRDVSRVFNAETLIVGLVAGVIGILVTLILVVIINIVLFALTDLVGLKAHLGFWPAFILVLVSMGLTLLAGLIPSRVAAKKDPVIALRTE